jgi:hypothetical protein
MSVAWALGSGDELRVAARCGPRLVELRSR